jgi:hypothetical protein
VVFNRRHRAIDDRAVVPEQQTAERGHGGYSDDTSAVFGFLIVQV